jgi:group I intron endonuclease
VIAVCNLKRVSGVYCAIHRETLRCYIGSSVDVHVRRLGHIREAKRGSLLCFHRAIKMLGEDSFDFELVEVCDKSLLRKREEFWIQFYGSAGVGGFNSNARPTASYTREVSDATRQRLRESSKRSISPEHLARIRDATRTPEVLARRSAARKGCVLTDEHKAKLSKAKTGRKLPPETLDKMRAAFTGRKFTDEWRAKISAAKKGQRNSQEAIERMRASKTGVPWSLKRRQAHEKRKIV